jgi:hypothetical protein
MRGRKDIEDQSTGATSTRAARKCCRDRKEAMDGSAFDRLVRHVGEDASRRGLLRSALAAAVGLGVVSALDLEDAEAKKGGRKRRRRRCKPKPLGAPCETDKDCCPKKTKRICEIEFGDSGGDKECCGGEGATCTSNAECCIGSAGVRAFVCNGTTCVPAPPDI